MQIGCYHRWYALTVNLNTTYKQYNPVYLEIEKHENVVAVEFPKSNERNQEQKLRAQIMWKVSGVNWSKKKLTFL